MESLKKTKTLKYLLNEKIIEKSQSYGNDYNDTLPSIEITNMDMNDDIYYLYIEKLIFFVFKEKENINRSLKSIEIHYKNLLTNKRYICKNEKNTEDEDRITEKYEFVLNDNDYITSFRIIYGRYYVIRSIKIKTKNEKKFDLPDFIERKSIKPDIYYSSNEINPDIRENIIINIFYGSGKTIHNIGCEYINQKFYRKILRIKYFMNLKAFKKIYKNMSFDEINSSIQKYLNGEDDVNIEYNEGKIIFLYKRYKTNNQMFLRIKKYK